MLSDLTKIFLIGLLISSCASTTPSKDKKSDKKLNDTESSSLRVALEYGRSSYLRGCMEALAEVGRKKVFNYCVKKSKKHIKDTQEILNN